MRALYEEMWRGAREAFARGRLEPDLRLDDPDDTRRGLSLIVRPEGEALAGLAALRDELAAIAPGHHVPATGEIHVTVLSLISCADGFVLDEDAVPRYAEVLGEALEGMAAFELTFRGITASPACVMAQGFPAGGALDAIRESLRRAVADSALPHAMERRYPARTAHATLLRFRGTAAPPALVERLDALRDRAFGRCRVEGIDLVFNDWYHRASAVRDLRRFALR